MKNILAVNVITVDHKTLLKQQQKKKQGVSGASLNPAGVIAAYQFCARRHQTIARQVCEAMRDFGRGKYKCKTCKYKGETK